MKISLKTILIILGFLLIAGSIVLSLNNRKQEHDVLETTLISDVRCFGTREFIQFSNDDPGGYSYQLTKLTINNDQSVLGELKYYPYATDSASGTFAGQYDLERELVDGVYDFYAEGTQNKEERRIKFNQDGIVFGFGPMQEDESGVYRYANESEIYFDYEVPLISCQRYEAWEEERKRRFESE